jgi:hypothetical protein
MKPDMQLKDKMLKLMKKRGKKMKKMKTKYLMMKKEVS